MLIDGVPITPAMYVRDLGIYLDRDLSMRTRVQRTVSRCFAALRQLRQIRHSVPASTFQTLVVALIHSRLDYGDSVLVGLPAYLMRRLQSVLNAAARLIFHLRRSDHISDALMPTLAAGSGAIRIQDRRAAPQSSLWRRTPVSGTTQPHDLVDALSAPLAPTV